MMLTNMKIDLQGDRAVATFLWHSIKSDLLTTEPKVTEYGRERTELVKQDGRWLISNRVVLTEGGMPEALLNTIRNNKGVKLRLLTLSHSWILGTGAKRGYPLSIMSNVNGLPPKLYLRNNFH